MKTQIRVRRLAGDNYEVAVEGSSATVHRVVLTEADCLRLAGPGGDAEELLRESFRFLLEREPNTSILRHFTLPVIGTYFPEYEREIQKRLAGRKVN